MPVVRFGSSNRRRFQKMNGQQDDLDLIYDFNDCIQTICLTLDFILSNKV